jgi:hypothetical protein
VALQGAQALNAKLVTLEKRLDGIAKQVAADSVPDVQQAVRGDIGDLSMSGWLKDDPLRAMVERNPRDGEAAIVPYGRQGGRFRVLESGRNADGGAGGFQGPGINFRTGRTSARARATGRGGSTKGRRWNGRTSGKGTWADAEKLVAQGLRKRGAKALHKVMASTFKGS